MDSRDINVQKTDTGTAIDFRLYLDCDSTLTRSAPSIEISKKFYEIVKNTQDNKQREKLIQTLIKDEIIKNDELGLADGTLQFLNNMLQENAEIIIVSRNFEEYIRALLLVEGMSQENVAKITIKGNQYIKKLNKSGTEFEMLRGKGQVVSIEENLRNQAKVTIVCDDIKFEMSQMVRNIKADNNNLLAYAEPHGTFDWQKIWNHAMILKCLHEATAYTKHYVDTKIWKVKKDYVTFSTEEDFESAIKTFKQLDLKSYFHYPTNYDFRRASKQYTLEVRNQIQEALENAKTTIKIQEAVKIDQGFYTTEAAVKAAMSIK